MTTQEINDFMQAKAASIAAQAGVHPDSVTIAYSSEDFDGEGAMPWIVRIPMSKGGGRRKKHSDAHGFGETIEAAAAMAVEDIGKWERAGYVRERPAA